MTKRIKKQRRKTALRERAKRQDSAPSCQPELHSCSTRDYERQVEEKDQEIYRLQSVVLAADGMLERAAARTAALRGYAVHREGCPARRLEVCDRACTCGLMLALAKP